jgi:hypothetical protein
LVCIAGPIGDSARVVERDPDYHRGMDARLMRRTFLWLFIGFLGLSALLAIVAVLGGSFGELQARVCASSATISAASVCALACAAFRERERGRTLGNVGIALAGLAAAALLLMIWGDGGKWPWRVTIVLAIWAAATAHAELLWLPRLRADHQWTQRALVGAIGVLSLLLTVLICGDASSEALMRITVVVAIVVALLTLVVPILAKIGSVAPDVGARAGQELVLRLCTDGAWIDATGARYEVRRLDPDRAGERAGMGSR